MPWGSPPTPDFGRLRRNTSLTKQQMDQLIRQYIPADSVEICKQRNRLNKTIMRCMKQKKFSELEVHLESLRSNLLPLDEVTYTSILFGYLVHPKHGLSAAESVCERMSSVDFIHPALKNFVSGFIRSLKSLEKFDALPNHTAVLKASIPFLEIATDVRKLRILAFRVTMDQRVKSGEVVLPNQTDQDDDYDLPQFDIEDDRL
jgi:hypothetical protein